MNCFNVNQVCLGSGFRVLGWRPAHEGLGALAPVGRHRHHLHAQLIQVRDELLQAGQVVSADLRATPASAPDLEELGVEGQVARLLRLTCAPHPRQNQPRALSLHQYQPRAFPLR